MISGLTPIVLLFATFSMSCLPSFEPPAMASLQCKTNGSAAVSRVEAEQAVQTALGKLTNGAVFNSKVEINEWKLIWSEGFGQRTTSASKSSTTLRLQSEDSHAGTISARHSNVEEASCAETVFRSTKCEQIPSLIQPLFCPVEFDGTSTAGSQMKLSQELSHFDNPIFLSNSLNKIVPGAGLPLLKPVVERAGDTSASEPFKPFEIRSAQVISFKGRVHYVILADKIGAGGDLNFGPATKQELNDFYYVIVIDKQTLELKRVQFLSQTGNGIVATSETYHNL